jgi:hypothetical protein
MPTLREAGSPIWWTNEHSVKVRYEIQLNLTLSYEMQKDFPKNLFAFRSSMPIILTERQRSCLKLRLMQMCFSMVVAIRERPILRPPVLQEEALSSLLHWIEIFRLNMTKVRPVVMTSSSISIYPKKERFLT